MPLRPFALFAALSLVFAPPLAFASDSADAALDALIARLSPEEKVAQLAGVRLNDLMVDGRLSLARAEKLVPHGIGHVSQFASCVALRPAELAATVAELQRFLISRNAARLPAIFHEEAITGFAARGTTTYPQQIGMGSTWRPDLVHANAAATARAMRAVGATQALSPMLDVIDDARWGRSEEGFGEDPYLTAVMGAAFIRGLQGDDDDFRTDVAATAKHFAGYGNSPADLALFRDEVLPPHEAAVFAARVSSVMPGYHSYRGEPASCSTVLLRQILRGEWAYDGAIVADYGAIGQIHSQYKFTPTALDGALRALAAGMDVELPSLSAYRDLPAALRDGRADVALIDAAIRRQLRLKQRLGLLDTDFSAPTAATLDLDPPDNQARALEAATQSIILLKNAGGLLPLSAARTPRLAVVGPNADSYYALLGDYTYHMMMEFWWRTPVDPTTPRLVTALAGLRERLAPAGFQIDYARGCDWTAGLDAKIITEGAIDDRLRTGQRVPLEKTPPTDLDAALRLAADSDVIIAALGENRYLCGEGVDRQDVRLPGEQEQFLERLAATGKPVVLVVFGGRPMALGAIERHCAAILYAWYPGQAGGHALADLLSGDASPSGRLTMTLPRTNEQVPTSYRRGYKPDGAPLYPFGHGLTYTTFAYSDLPAPAATPTTAATVSATFTLKNTGSRPGVEVAQLYLRRPGAPGVLARQQLRGFARLALAPGESRAVTIDIPLELLGHSAEDGRLLIKPGPVELLVGPSASETPLRATFELTGDTATQPRRQVFFSTTRL
jgi:beta-glucosidase